MKTLLAVLTASLMAFPAFAQQPQCMGTIDLYAALHERYGEAQQFFGLSGSAVLEMWANRETGSWTLISTSPNGVSCLIAAGEAFQPVPQGDPA